MNVQLMSQTLSHIFLADVRPRTDRYRAIARAGRAATGLDAHPMRTRSVAKMVQADVLARGGPLKSHLSAIGAISVWPARRPHLWPTGDFRMRTDRDRPAPLDSASILLASFVRFNAFFCVFVRK